MNNQTHVNTALQALFYAEISNERDGGINPSTLGSSLDSLVQMPEYVLFDLNQEARSIEGLCTFDEVEQALKDLIGKHGSNTPLADALNLLSANQ